MNAYDAWLESPYQEAASYDEALEAAEEIESAQLTRELNSKPSTRVEMFDEAMGYRTEAQADAMALAWSKQDNMTMALIVTELLQAQFEREVEMRAIKECA